MENTTPLWNDSDIGEHMPLVKCIIGLHHIFHEV